MISLTPEGQEAPVRSARDILILLQRSSELFRVTCAQSYKINAAWEIMV